MFDTAVALMLKNLGFDPETVKKQIEAVLQIADNVQAQMIRIEAQNADIISRLEKMENTDHGKQRQISAEQRHQPEL